MNLNNILSIVQVVLAALLVASILLQARGTGLGSSFGGEGNVYRTKRGVEKRLFQATIVLAILFFGVSLANALV
ncbi:preprotein translocase subunit SecG [Candidatus Uhrbacteria bacterium RIFOXYB12_FULL_58_10]|uniref:Protein-export membrane protein SecG n=1 Tax=Candidatus Uhrbacteria bacterium RIFOXYB2_FULL_57_15 TaxID=1802422 RepID=A0A1F7W744_9BACT|nr:MAG: preprotein translocase subunit SecG [Candidatus Uhrbacteria bacterium RIFOXYB12_FULL_58_10]OGL98599.1 MAG: preprotein translocase subunit SecG [Candidatus Uhrbacteria bacterium RIFOXYB2_FULL_57_15]OGM00595.1 MAG: preprotein translocase subunit SecG [Candidatus Uhrbacteria bacterium RIFOXYC12_FULL_57_11]